MSGLSERGIYRDSVLYLYAISAVFDFFFASSRCRLPFLPFKVPLIALQQRTTQEVATNIAYRTFDSFVRNSP